MHLAPTSCSVSDYYRTHNKFYLTAFGCPRLQIINVLKAIYMQLLPFSNGINENKWNENKTESFDARFSVIYYFVLQTLFEIYEV